MKDSDKFHLVLHFLFCSEQNLLASYQIFKTWIEENIPDRHKEYGYIVESRIEAKFILNAPLDYLYLLGGRKYQNLILELEMKCGLIPEETNLD